MARSVGLPCPPARGRRAGCGGRQGGGGGRAWEDPEEGHWGLGMLLRQSTLTQSGRLENVWEWGRPGFLDPCSSSSSPCRWGSPCWLNWKQKLELLRVMEVEA